MNQESRQFHVGKPNIGDRDAFQRRVSDIMHRAWLTNDGPLVRELEARLAGRLGVAHCVAMCNGTVALELAIRATGMQGEAIVPSMTFVATAHALQWQGITPVFCDIDAATLNIAPERVRQLITSRTSGIIGVHLYGRGCDVEALQSIADEHDLALVFDAAHAFGASYRGQKIGNFGRCEAFSFHATKVFNCFEGGAVTTNDAALADKLRLMRNFGFEREDEVSYVGTNGKMSEICAAMGLTNLESVDRFIAANRENYLAYREGLRDCPGIDLLRYDEGESNNYQYVIIRVDETCYGRPRDALKSRLEAEGVMARRYFYPGCHRMEPYHSLYPDAGAALPVTEAFNNQVLALPTGTQMSPDRVAWICDLIVNYCDS